MPYVYGRNNQHGFKGASRALDNRYLDGPFNTQFPTARTAGGALTIIDGSEVLGQNKSPLLFAAVQGDHKMSMSGKKDGKGFQHVHVPAIHSAGKAIFLGTHVGLFRSDDFGHSWKKVPLSTKQSNFDVMTVTPDLKEPETIYVATPEGGTFKSTDGGASWNEINAGLGGPDVHAIDPNDGKLHALVREKEEGIYRRTPDRSEFTPEIS